MTPRAPTRERELLAQLAENAEELRRTSFRAGDLDKLQDRLAGQFKAAEGSRLEEIAAWARELATQAALMTRLRERMVAILTPGHETLMPALTTLAEETHTDLARQPVRPLVNEIETALSSINTEVGRLGTDRATALRAAAAPLDNLMQQWQIGHTELKQRLEIKQTELEAQGLKVEGGEIRRLGRRMEELGKSISTLQERQRSHRLARQQRDRMLAQLRGNRDELRTTPQRPPTGLTGSERWVARP